MFAWSCLGNLTQRRSHCHNNTTPLTPPPPPPDQHSPPIQFVTSGRSSLPFQLISPYSHPFTPTHWQKRHYRWREIRERKNWEGGRGRITKKRPGEMTRQHHLKREQIKGRAKKGRRSQRKMSGMCWWYVLQNIKDEWERNVDTIKDKWLEFSI